MTIHSASPTRCVTRKSTKEIIILVTCKTNRKLYSNHPLIGNEERSEEDTSYQAFLAIINLDEELLKNQGKYEEQDKSIFEKQSEAKKMVSLHQIQVPQQSEDTRDGRWEYTENLQFEPRKLSLNPLETAFVLYGENGILVGNCPASFADKEHYDYPLFGGTVNVKPLHETWPRSYVERLNSYLKSSDNEHA